VRGTSVVTRSDHHAAVSISVAAFVNRTPNQAVNLTSRLAAARPARLMSLAL